MRPQMCGGGAPVPVGRRAHPPSGCRTAGGDGDCVLRARRAGARSAARRETLTAPRRWRRASTKHAQMFVDVGARRSVRGVHAAGRCLERNEKLRPGCELDAPRARRARPADDAARHRPGDVSRTAPCRGLRAEGRCASSTWRSGAAREIGPSDWPLGACGRVARAREAAAARCICAARRVVIEQRRAPSRRVGLDHVAAAFAAVAAMRRRCGGRAACDSVDSSGAAGVARRQRRRRAASAAAARASCARAAAHLKRPRPKRSREAVGGDGWMPRAASAHDGAADARAQPVRGRVDAVRHRAAQRRRRRGGRGGGGAPPSGRGAARRARRRRRRAASAAKRVHDAEAARPPRPPRVARASPSSARGERSSARAAAGASRGRAQTLAATARRRAGRPSSRARARPAHRAPSRLDSRRRQAARKRDAVQRAGGARRIAEAARFTARRWFLGGDANGEIARSRRRGGRQSESTDLATRCERPRRTHARGDLPRAAAPPAAAIDYEAERCAPVARRGGAAAAPRACLEAAARAATGGGASTSAVPRRRPAAASRRSRGGGAAAGGFARRRRRASPAPSSPVGGEQQRRRGAAGRAVWRAAACRGRRACGERHRRLRPTARSAGRAAAAAPPRRSRRRREAAARAEPAVRAPAGRLADGGGTSFKQCVRRSPRRALGCRGPRNAGCDAAARRLAPRPPSALPARREREVLGSTASPLSAAAAAAAARRPRWRARARR